MSKKATSNILLLITAFVWGVAFVAQKEGGAIGALTYNGLRTFLGGLVLIPVIMIMNRGNEEAQSRTEEEKARLRKMNIIGGITCGIFLCLASSLQQYGLYFTTAGKAGFITTLYTIIVPFLAVFLGKKIRPIIWLCVILGVTGLYFLTMDGEHFSIQIGDLFVLACAFAFAVHILVIDYFSPKCDGPTISCIQFLFAGGICIILAFIFEDPNLSSILDSWLPIAYGGIGSCAIGYTLQIVGQKHADPTEASLILCLESVFSVLAGAVLLGERMDIRGYAGCLLIFAAVVISQLPSKEERLARKKGA